MSASENQKTTRHGTDRTHQTARKTATQSLLAEQDRSITQSSLMMKTSFEIHLYHPLTIMPTTLLLMYPSPTMLRSQLVAQQTLLARISAQTQKKSMQLLILLSTYQLQTWTIQLNHVLNAHVDNEASMSIAMKIIVLTWTARIKHEPKKWLPAHLQDVD
jgi:hypothetical protein